MDLFAGRMTADQQEVMAKFLGIYLQGDQEIGGMLEGCLKNSGLASPLSFLPMEAHAET